MSLLANAVAICGFFAFGFAVWGRGGVFLAGKPLDGQTLAMFFYLASLAGVAAIIPVGACAERWSLAGILLFSLVIGAALFPAYGGWVWGGWLARLGEMGCLGHGVVDHSGSSVIHLQAGALAMICAAMLGPRIGKYDENARPRPIIGHHIPMMFLGTIILLVGGFGINLAWSLTAGDGRAFLIGVNTMLAAAAGMLSSCVYMWWRFGRPDPSMMCNGLVAGIVAIAAPCAFVAPWAAFIIGAVAGTLAVISVFFWEHLGVDDPVGAISTHGVSGIWGMLAVGLLADGTGGTAINGAGGNVVGLFYDHAAGMHQLLAQLIGIAVCLGWNVIPGGAAFWIIGKATGGNRVAGEVEVAGLDIPQLGAPGYPEFINVTVPEQALAEDLTNARRAIMAWSK